MRLFLILRKPSKPFCKGFTLAELLIVLAVLAIIAVFAIPKILQSQQDARKLAVYKETNSTIQALVFQGVQLGEMNNANTSEYMLSHVNAIKLCPNNSSSEGCWNTGIQGGGVETDEPGFVLSNGATVAGLNNTGNIYANGFKIDWNGVQPPNTLGDDQLYLYVYYMNSAPCYCYTSSYKTGIGTTCPVWAVQGGTAANAVLFDQIFQP